jgi:endonuclease YncB( thermonuclease family)
MRHTVLRSSFSLRLVILALAAALAVMLAIAVRAHAVGQCPRKECVEVSATARWTATPVTVNKGDSFSADYANKKWTVGYPDLKTVGPWGYRKSVDKTLYQGCKIKPNRPYGRLLGRVGQGSNFSRIFSVGSGGIWTATRNGRLYLRINDADQCLGDNAGSVRMRVWRY